MISHGDLAWMLTSTALVLLMVPSVGLLYAGMVRRKNVISTVLMCFVALAITILQWTAFGYSIAFGPDIAGIVGSLKYAGLVHLEPIDYWYVAFQLMFAAVTLAIIVSPFVERAKFPAFLVLGLLWLSLVYCPVAHWLWGSGWLAKLGALDFAGGMVVHETAGFSALAIALLIGRRIGYGEYPIRPHNIPMTLLGTALLWFGWMGFNAGSALAANAVACNALMVTNIAAAAGAITWMLISWIREGKPSSLGFASGAIAGLAAITPAAGYVGPGAAVLIGIIAGILCYAAMLLRIKLNIDESMDAWSVHGIGGIWGALALGIFATRNAKGLILGNVHQFIAQLIGVAAVGVYSFIVTLALAKLVDLTIGLRVRPEEEYVGLDLSQHKEIAYS